MKVSAQIEVEILRLHHAEQWRVGTIAVQLGVHHSVVRRVLAQAGLPVPAIAPRPSLADPYLSWIREMLERYPKLHASRLHQMAKQRGYPGGESRFREIVALMRPVPKAEAFLRLRTLPGEQGQVDWGHFGTLRIGRAERLLMAFVMVLSWSRKIFLRFFLGSRMPVFLEGHVRAFRYFGGVPRNLLYDNLKSAVMERVGDAIRFHPSLLALAGHYRFGPRPVAPARGNEKGRVERAIRFIRDSFFAARVFRDIDDLNAQAEAWCDTVASDRRWPDDHARTVQSAFEEEKPRLLPLPENPFACDENLVVSVGKTPYVRFDLNDYSVPHTLVGCELSVSADLARVRIVDRARVVADHPRSYSRGEQIEDPEHIASLTAEKREARQHRGMDRLHRAAPASQDFLVRAAERGLNLGSLVAQLLGLLDEYGAAPLDDALREVAHRGVAHVPAVRQLLEQQRHARRLPPPLAAAQPSDPRVRDVVVRPHALSTYDRLAPQEDGGDDDA